MTTITFTIIIIIIISSSSSSITCIYLLRSRAPRRALPV